MAMRSRTALPLTAREDPEGERLPDDLPSVVDAHVHVFPDRIFDAVWRWFDKYGWPVRYKLYADEVIQALRARGVAHQVLLHYAHKPGLARHMNAFVAELIKRHPDVTGLATVYPGEPEQEQILEDAFAAGLRGVKLHCHVQGMPPDAPALSPVYALCAERGLPVVIHAGREPHSEHVPVDPYTICEVSRVERIVQQFPRLKLCVPHLGADEFAAYAALMVKHDNLWLDTTMMLAEFFDTVDVTPFVRARPERVLFGTDFPNLPYAWDREATRVARMSLSDRALEQLCGGSARELFDLPAISR
jgi:uncharacterized protein